MFMFERKLFLKQGKVFGVFKTQNLHFFNPLKIGEFRRSFTFH